jgi:hypothetical protein
MWQIQRQKESDARRRITEWFGKHPDKHRCSAYYTIAGGHFVNGIEKNERGIIQMRTDTGALVDLMHFGADVLSGVVSVMEQ